jgi:DNA topoisomerase I
MGKTLVIVESPAKINKISSYLGKDYIVKASFGHIMDIKKGVIPCKENNFHVDYEILKGKHNVVKDLIDSFKICDNVLLATDLDREGEVIAYCIARVLKIKEPQRIIFNEITKKALLSAVANPRKMDYNLVDAQKTRRYLDRLVGFKLSPLLWKKISSGLSAGRVQSPVLRLVVEREDDANNFQANKCFKFKGSFKDNVGEVMISEMIMNTLNKEKSSKNELIGEITKKENENDVKDILNKFMDCLFKVYSIFEKKSDRKPNPPFITSTLLQEANRKCGFSSKKTMMLAQKLYEEGHITYMRTDSVTLSEDAMDQLKEYIVFNYGENYYKGKQYKNPSKNTQEAHEAIRPTLVKQFRVTDDPNQQKLYELIWSRAVASQMSSAQINTTVIQINSEETNYYFEKSISRIIFDGFLKVYNDLKLAANETSEEDDKDDIINNLPKINQKMKVKSIIAKEEYTKSTPRYSEASLQKKMKDLDIGRPSTYASMISLLLDREYVEKKNITAESKSIKIIQLKNKKISESKSDIKIGGEKNRLVPTITGINIIKFLNENFTDIIDYKFTAKLESDLDKIASGKKKMDNVLLKFNDDFTPKVDELNNQLGNKPMKEKGKLLGIDSITGYEIYITKTKYGNVIKLNSDKPKYVNISKPLTSKNITLEKAIELLKYPIKLGNYNDKVIEIYNGQHGLYAKYDNNNYSLDKLLELNDVIKIIEGKKESNKNILKTFNDKKMIYEIRNGPYGNYLMIKGGKKPIIKNIPKGTDIDKLTIENLKNISKSNNDDKTSKDKKYKNK